MFLLKIKQSVFDDCMRLSLKRDDYRFALQAFYVRTITIGWDMFYHAVLLAYAGTYMVYSELDYIDMKWR